MSATALLPYADELAETFGLGSLRGVPAPVARGQQGVVWRFDTDAGPYAVKHLLDRTTASAVVADVTFQEAMLRRADLFLPTPLRSVGGQPLVEVGGLQVRAYTWVDLLPPPTQREPALVGSLFAAVHRDPIAAVGPVDGWYVEPVSASDWRRLADGLAAADAPFAAEFAAFSAAHQELQQLLEPPRDLQLCHRDLWLDNAPLAVDGRICVLDWENSGPADPAHELATALYECCAADPGSAGRLYEAYLRGGGTGRLEGRGVFSMAIAELGHFAVTAATRWSADTGPADRVRNEAWLREGHDQPLTVDLIDALLDACT